MSPSLPVQPDLDHLRKQAKALLRDVELAVPAALERMRRVPKLASLVDKALAEEAQLADAQHVIALEYGAESWPKLKAAVEVGMPLDLQAEHFLRHLRDEEHDAAARWLERVPAIASVNIFTACAAGDEATVMRLLAADPTLATAKHSQREFTAILYASASPLPADAPALERIVRALLAAGADANSAYPGVGEGPPQTAMYRACLRGHAGVVGALLEHGGRTDDGECIAHAAEHAQFACLEAMKRHGADFSARQQPYDNTPLYFLAGYTESHRQTATAQAGMRWLLANGANPNATSYKSNEAPLHQVARANAGLAIATALIDAGADPNAARADGRTPYALACRHGRNALAELLRERGARTELSALDRFIAAAFAGDEPLARRLLAETPGLIASFSDEDRGLMAQSARQDQGERMALLVSLGFDLSWETAWGGTPLHQAAWHGHVALARELVRIGAPRDLRDKTYGSSPLAWAVHGSHYCRSADEDYLAVVQLLLEAGSSRAASINKWNEPPESMGARRVNAYLERWYREHPEQLAT